MNNTEQTQHPSQQILSTDNAPLIPKGCENSRTETSVPEKPAIFTEAKPLSKKHFVLPRKSCAQNKQRSAEKEQLVAEFLGSGEVWSSLPILTQVLKIETKQTRVTLNRMVDKNLLQKEILPDGLTIYGITRTGIALVKDQANSKAFQIGRTPQSTVQHHLLIQKVRLHFALMKTSGWLPGKAIYKNKNYPLINIADSCFQFMNMTCVLEVELFVKSNKRMKVILENYVHDLTNTQYGKPLLGRVYYFTPHVDLLENLIDCYVPSALRDCFTVIFLNTEIPPYASSKQAPESVKSGDGGKRE